MQSVQFYYTVIFSTAAVYFLLFWFVVPVFSRCLFKTYKTLSPKDNLLWRCRYTIVRKPVGDSFISLLHSSLVGTWAIYNFVKDEEIYSEPIWSDSDLVRTSCAIVLGYMLSDTFVLQFYDDELRERMLLLHHIITAFADYFIVINGILPFFANFRLIAELSTPFVRLWWLFRQCGYDSNHWLPRLNLLILISVFGFLRVLLAPIFWYKVSSITGTYEFEDLGNIRHVVVLACVFLDIINVSWFFKLCYVFRSSLVKKKSN